MLESILKEDDKPSLPKREKALLEQAIFQVYEQHQIPVLSDLRHLLLNHADAEIDGTNRASEGGEGGPGRARIGSTQRKVSTNHRIQWCATKLSSKQSFHREVDTAGQSVCQRGTFICKGEVMLGHYLLLH